MYFIACWKFLLPLYNLLLSKDAKTCKKFWDFKKSYTDNNSFEIFVMLLANCETFLTFSQTHERFALLSLVHKSFLELLETTETFLMFFLTTSKKLFKRHWKPRQISETCLNHSKFLYYFPRPLKDIWGFFKAYNYKTFLSCITGFLYIFRAVCQLTILIIIYLLFTLIKVY